MSGARLPGPEIGPHSPFPPAPRRGGPGSPATAAGRGAGERPSEPRPTEPRPTELRLSVMSHALTRLRRPPSPRRLARRRMTIRLTKLLLPSLALALLAALAIWPDLRRQTDEARLSFQRFAQGLHGDTLYGARYHGMDQQGQPYTVTAASATQLGPNHVALDHPKGDITLQGGAWLMLESKRGVYRQTENALDLSRDVTLYRDDGTTVVTDSAAIDLHSGAAAGAAPVHANGPFGTLFAQGGFTLLDRGGSLQFAGPVRLVLDGASR